MVASEWNPPNEDGTLQNVEDDWALAPGTTSRYYAASVTIPEDWEGPKQLEVYVTAAYRKVHTMARASYTALAARTNASGADCLSVAC